MVDLYLGYFLQTAREKLARSTTAGGEEESTSRWSTGEPTPLRALPTIAQPPKPETLVRHHVLKRNNEGYQWPVTLKTSVLTLSALCVQSALWREHGHTVGGEDEHECVICLDNFTTVRRPSARAFVATLSRGPGPTWLIQGVSQSIT